MELVFLVPLVHPLLVNLPVLPVDSTLQDQLVSLVLLLLEDVPQDVPLKDSSNLTLHV